MVNRIALSLQVLSGDQTRAIDGIEFRECGFVHASIDGSDILEDEFFEGSLIVFDELEKSLDGNGEYLIFTCACGVADDGGWLLTGVETKDDGVFWQVKRPEGMLVFEFELVAYNNSIRKLSDEVRELRSNHIALEPTSIIYPE